MKNNKKWFSVLFVLILVWLVWFLWIIVLNKNQIFQNLNSYTQLSKKQNQILLEKINQKIKLFKLDPALSQKQITFNLSNHEFVNIYTFNEEAKKFLLTNKINPEIESISLDENYYLNLEISNPVDLKVMKFSQWKTELLNNVKIEEFRFSTWWILSQSLNNESWTWTFKTFKFDNNFALLAKSLDDNSVIKISFKNSQTWSGVFINPISQTWSIVYWNISNIIEKWWKYFLKSLNF